MEWDLQFSPAAIRDLKKLSPDRFSQAAKLLDALSVNPYPVLAKKLKGVESKLNIHHLRSGDLRIVYQIINKRLIILVLVVADRKEVYQLLRKRLGR